MSLLKRVSQREILPMQISEIFYSIQGEGILAGVPSLFIRTSGCNLRCTWCDTPYTSWNPEGTPMRLGAILAQARRDWPNHVVITGGEPMIAQQIVLLTKQLREVLSGIHITIETAGTVFEPVECDLMSISPKLANSVPVHRDGGIFAKMHEEKRRDPKVLKKLIRKYDYQLKFVISTREDVTEAMDLVREIKADTGKVILMPEGTHFETLRERSKWLAEVCKDKKVRLGPRLHIDIWGNERGK